MRYQVKYGDSPAIIARKFGVALPTLIRANPHKPVATVAGTRTWSGLRSGETVNVPVGVGDGYLGAVAPAQLAAPHAMIRQGSSGPDVALWQTIIGTTPDGQFGPNTKAATIAWQKSHGLTADGVVGPLTWAAAVASAVPAAAAPLFSAAAPLFSAAVTAPAPVPTGHATIRQGSTGPDVRTWQTIVGVTPDGQFGPATAAATRAWQSAHGLMADGVVGPLTWAAATGAPAAPAAPAPAAPSITLPAIPGLTPPISLPLPAAPVPAPSLPTTLPSSSLAVPAGAALAALMADPNYCTSVASPGTAVNTAVHNFKVAWNAVNPRNAVPVGTGKYEPSVAAALSSALGDVSVPPGCGAPALAPVAPAPAPVVPPVPPLPPPLPLPGPALPAPPALPPAPSPVAPPAMPSAPPSPAQPIVTAPAPKAGLSTGAIVAGAIGAVALVGLVAVAAGGKKQPHARRATPVHRRSYKPRRKSKSKRR